MKKSEADSVKRRELAKRLAGYVNEIAEVLRRSRENNYITDVDAAMLKGRMSNIHSELYGGYKEFTEVDMTLEQMYKTSVFKKMEDAEAKGEKRGLKQGMSQGINQGLTQAAKAMKAAGDTVSKIMRCTGLSRREITAL